MATSLVHSHAGFSSASAHPLNEKERSRSRIAVFFGDLIEDLRQRPLQAAHLAKHDMFREHINAMSISYFSLILLLILGSIPMLVFLVPFLTQ